MLYNHLSCCIEADLDAASELFLDTKKRNEAVSTTCSLTSGIAGASLKTIKDHETFALTIASKLEESKSTSFNLSAFYMKLTNEIKNKLTSENIDEVLLILQTLKEKKKLLESKAKPVVKKTVSQIKKETKKHNDVFGGSNDYDDKYSNYEVRTSTSILIIYITILYN
jgi:hypothetical protein